MRRILTLLCLIGVAGATLTAPVSGQEAEEKPTPPPEPPTVRAWMTASGPVGYLGVAIREVTDDDVEELDLPAERGAVVEEVLDDTPAEEAGLQEGDVIVAWAGETVRSTAQLRRLVRETPPGREVTVRIVRDGEESSVSLEAGRRGPMAPAMPQLHGRIDRAMERLEHRMEHREGAMERPHRPMRGMHLRPDRPMVRMHLREHPGRLGVRLRGLTDQLAGYFGLEDDDGALVVSVKEDSPGARAGLRAGDVIVSIGEEEISSPREAAWVLRDAGENTVRVTVVRDGERRTVEVTLSEEG